MSFTSIDKCETILLYDFSNLAYASYYAAKSSGSSYKYLFVDYALSKLQSQLAILADRSTALVFVLDEFPKHKREIVPSYKANREPLDDDPRPYLIKLFRNTNTYFASCKDQEADDVIASLCKKYMDKGVIIVTRDEDMLQLNGMAHVEIFDLVKNNWFEREDLKRKYGLKRWRKIALYKACFGDTSDNIKPALPRVRKANVIPTIEESLGLNDFIRKFRNSEQTDKTKELFKSNMDILRANYKIVKLNHNLKVKLKRNLNDHSAFAKALRKHKIKKSKASILF